eukprot:c5809_g1_i1.p4 GENE.c5809_g1_i1~~c5809_g1_i1.p4  ORF type:complete len:104 (+),score=18.21 c5809_g1_i1:618-929(+)
MAAKVAAKVVPMPAQGFRNRIRVAVGAQVPLQVGDLNIVGGVPVSSNNTVFERCADLSPGIHLFGPVVTGVVYCPGWDVSAHISDGSKITIGGDITCHNIVTC